MVIVRKIGSQIKDKSHFLKKFKELGSLTKNTILCTIHVFGLYPNIAQEESFALIKKHLHNRESKGVATDALI